MSSSYSCEQVLRELASELRQKADELEQAAEALAILRGNESYKEKITSAKSWAIDWIKRDLKP